VTAVADERDVHVLAYFFDPSSPVLTAFLARQRESRVTRVREMFAKLAAHGIHLDVERILAPGLEDASRAVGRPWIARALVEGRYVATVNDAFAKWLGRGCPAFVPRTGASPEAVIATIHECGGIASLAHPVLVEHDEWIPGWAEAGLDALEAFHSDHSAVDTARYLGMARELNLRVTGGSDYHGDNHHGSRGPGSVTLPQRHWELLIANC
jgi:predicted metal-dependent phosphoesterase TrpH